MSDWPEHPRVSWLLKHLLVAHNFEVDYLEGKHVDYITAFHDGLHVEVDAAVHHDGYDDMRAKEKEWFMRELGIRGE